jgi:4-hydroxy-4-methyl-2-oxoglutarate aldolase
MEVKDFERPPKEMIEEFKRYSTPNISDALDRLGIKGGCEGIRPVLSGVKMVGPALTTYRLPGDPVHPKKAGDYLDYVKPGDVIVIDNGGRTYCTVWGDILTIAAMELNLAGTVIDGCCRDVDKIREFNYPVFSLGIFMMTGKDRTQLEAINVPVAVRNVRVNPGDLVMGDASGVVIIPRGKAEEVLKAAREIDEAENLIKSNVKRGLDREDAHLTLAEARKKFGYWDLQRKK